MEDELRKTDAEPALAHWPILFQVTSSSQAGLMNALAHSFLTPWAASCWSACLLQGNVLIEVCVCFFYPVDCLRVCSDVFSPVHFSFASRIFSPAKVQGIMFFGNPYWPRVETCSLLQNGSFQSIALHAFCATASQDFFICGFYLATWYA